MIGSAPQDDAGRRRGRRVCAPIGLAAALLAGCSGDDEKTGDLVVYVSADDHLARQVIARFEEVSGIAVAMVGDTEANKTTALANRIRSERDNPQADVFWSSECFMAIALAQEGLLEPSEIAAPQGWPGQFVGGEGRWFGFAPRARVLVYNTERVTRDELPVTWAQLSRERWMERIVIADPRFGTTRGHMGAMKVAFESQMPGAYEAFLQNLAFNRTRMLTSGNAGVVDAVARGEADIGLTDTDDVWAAQRNGAPVELVYLAHGDPATPGEGALVIPNTVAIVKGSRRRDEAARFIEFLLSEEVERLLVESDSHNIPLRESVASAHPRYAVPFTLDIDLVEAAAAMDEAVSRAMEVLGGSDDAADAPAGDDAGEGG